MATKKDIISELIEETSKEFDTRKVLNLAPDYHISKEFMLKLIEEGLTLEMLEEMLEKKAVCMYKTQFTLHGIFPEGFTDRIHGFKNCTRNGNGSLGIRYNAIDVQKKLDLDELLKFIRHNQKLSIPTLRRDSSGMLFRLIKREAAPITEAYNRIDTSLFYGTKSKYKVLTPFGTYTYVLDVHVGVMEEGMIWNIFTNWTGITQEKYNELKKIEDDKETASELARKAEIKRQAKLCNENYEAALTQLTNLPIWDNVVSDNIILVSGLKHTLQAFEFLRLQPINFNKVEYVRQIHEQFATGFETNKIPLIKTLPQAVLIERLNKRKWFVWKQGEKPQEKQKPQPKVETKATQTMQTVTPGDLVLLEYSQKGIAVFGKTKLYAKLLGKSGLGGGYNDSLTHPITKEKTPGWIFPKTRTAEIEETLKVKMMPLKLAMSA